MITKEITTWPCLEDETLKKECFENSSHVKINEYRPHTCGAQIVKVVEVVEIEPKKFEFFTREQIKALETKEQKRRAQKINATMFIRLDTGTRHADDKNESGYYTALKSQYSHDGLKVFKVVKELACKI